MIKTSITSLFIISVLFADNKLLPLKHTNLYKQKIKNCLRLDLSTWSHPTRKIIQEDRYAKLHWVELCNNKKYPIFGIDFTYDPLGLTGDYFKPFYMKFLKANGSWPLALVSIRDNLIIYLNKVDKGYKIDYERFSSKE